VSIGIPSSRFYKYDPVLNEWIKIENYHEDRRAVRAYAIDFMGFVFGGYKHTERPNREFYAYNANVNEWEARESTTASGSARSYPVMEAYNGKVYMMGGLDAQGNYLRNFWEYNPGEDEWTQLLDFEGDGRTTASSFVLNGLIYIGLGKDASTHFQDWYVYDPEAETWTQAENFPLETTYGNVFFSIGNKGYVGTGAHNANEFRNKFLEFIPKD